MIISHKHKFIFLKTRKTASTSIELALTKFCGDDDIITPLAVKDEETKKELGLRGQQNLKVGLAKYNASEYKQLLLKGKRVAFYNHIPARKVVRYLGENKWDNYFKFCFERNPFDRVISQYYWVNHIQNNKYNSIEEFLLDFPENRLTNWSIYSLQNKICVDYIGKFEDLNQDFQKIWEKLNIDSDFPELPKAKGAIRKDRRDYRDVLDEKSIELISSICENEIHEFGYQY